MIISGREKKEIPSDCMVDFLGLEYLSFNIILDIADYLELFSQISFIFVTQKLRSHKST